MEKEYIFPMNYKNKEKFLGVIDYKIIFLIAIFLALLFVFLRKLDLSVMTKIVVFILLGGFFSILMIVGINGENMPDFIYFMLKYLVREKVYVYRKSDEGGVKCENLLKHISQ